MTSNSIDRGMDTGKIWVTAISDIGQLAMGYRTTSELAFHLGHELVRQWYEGAFNKPMSRPGWLSKWLSLNL